MNRLSFFRLNNTLQTYTFPIFKIVLCITIILSLVFRNHFIHIEHLSWKIIVGVFCIIVCLACVLCIYISVAEIIVVHDHQSENPKFISPQSKDCRWLSVDKVVSLISQNDIIDIQILLKDSCIKIGASSDLKPGDSVFFDKHYYIGHREYENLEIFKAELLNYSADGQILVFQIDGVSPKYYQL